MSNAVPLRRQGADVVEATARSKTARRPRIGPGRPEGVSRIRDDILDGAEIEFADRGYMGTSLRNVAERANVTQALINYFGSKQGLFAEVYLRNGREIVAERTKRLTALRRRRKPPGVRDVIEAFLLPALKRRETPGGRNFMRLNARLHTEPPRSPTSCARKGMTNRPGRWRTCSAKCCRI